LTGVAVKVILVPAHRVVALALMLTDGVRLLTTVKVMAFELTTGAAVQGALEVSWQVTISPLTQPEAVYVALLLPTLLPFFFHWYTGLVPPPIMLAVNVALAPVQIVVDGVVMEMLAVLAGSTFRVMLLEL